MLQNLNTVLRTGLLGVIVLIAGWWTLFLRGKLGDHESELQERDDRITELVSHVSERDTRIQQLDETIVDQTAQIEELDATVQAQAEEIEALAAALDFLKVDHRLAKIEVLEQTPREDEPGKYRTRVRFTEYDPAGEPIGEGREIEVDGKLVYLETLVVKFDDSYVEDGDVLRGSSICIFKRLFGEDQKPSEGEPLDAAGVQPLVYTGDNPNPFHRMLWERFWDYANDPDFSAAQGVRAIHGEAPFMEMRPGKTYRVELRASGGLTIQAE